ncbi:uncharacterized protein E0L32_002201 [Thyridium curvatum]|uniref:SGF29 C-terminal domain-containing protein n=1 Tax=Thyridium curvatum TaxID=1093900 RepID=A0A507ACX2_9PEZI|nr:uncharacterized protein E0L32_002201 [Thyridium curvatum]TPX06705.1 hypothetical protein E0L32_002201 [Thyridium curvatum]
MADKATDKQLKHLKSDFGSYWHKVGSRRTDSRDSVSSSDRSADVTPAPGASSPPRGRSASSGHKHSRSHGGSQSQQARNQHSQHRRNNSSTDKTRATTRGNDSPGPSPIRSSVTSNPRRQKGAAEPSPTLYEPEPEAAPAAASAPTSAPASASVTPAQPPAEEESAADEDQALGGPPLDTEEASEDNDDDDDDDDDDDIPPQLPSTGKDKGKGKGKVKEKAVAPSTNMSQRGRSQRGPNRNSGLTEEQALWQNIQEGVRTVVDECNANNDNLRSLVAQDEYMAKNKDTMDAEEEEKKYETQIRGGLKANETLLDSLKQTIERVQILSALQKAKEQKEAESRGTLGSSRSGSALLSGSGGRSASRAGTRERGEKGEKEKDKDPSSLYDFDGAGDSPVPSPIGGHTRKLGGSGGGGGGGPSSDRSGNRDSVPPRGGDRDTPAKADSVEPQVPGSAAQRSRMNFVKGQDVAFKAKPANADNYDWFLGKVQQVLGEGKSRRYKVKDEDPDIPTEQRQEYRTSASSMIPIPPVGQELTDLDKGKTVLALYPDSTTFYKAEVMGTDKDTGKVSLRFEGEETTGTLQLVERRFVLEYRS